MGTRDRHPPPSYRVYEVQEGAEVVRLMVRARARARARARVKVMVRIRFAEAVLGLEEE